MDNNKTAKITHIVIDVDGTMTDGGIYYDDNRNELKKFNTRDAAGFFAATIAGIKTIVLTGRECKATLWRMRDLKADIVKQGISDKAGWLSALIDETGLTAENLAYIGDDLNDIRPMKLCVFVACPADACEEVKAISDYVSVKNGGFGAVRDCIEHILKQRGEWEIVIEKVYQLSGK
jgi:3-deoxy-D-manno-octulosonate 8-phosphate phosphatase (KDO 8-P phosphatase)